MVTQSYVIFCTSGSVVWIIPNVTNIFTKLNPLKGVRNIYTNEELQRMEFKDAFCKKFKLLGDRFSSLLCQTQRSGRENDPSKEK